MSFRFLLAAICLLATACATHVAESAKQASRVTVVFVLAEKFTDCRDEYVDTGRGRERILTEIQNTFQEQGSRYVAEGQYLEIKVTDIDRAGDFEPWRNPGSEDIRYMREIYPPRMDLAFRLTAADGTLIREGRRQLQQLGFLMSATFPTWDPLRFDKEMLRDWMAREFKPAS